VEKKRVNLLEDLSPEKLSQRGLTWEHAPLKWEPLPGSGLGMHVPPQSDYFRDPGGSAQKDDAPYLWMNVTGNFVARALVRAPQSTLHWDAGAIMARQDAQHWVKVCYERTDWGVMAAVAVVTNGTSDDGNGTELSLPEVWLQIHRTGDVFGLHYSVDGQTWRMVRLLRMAMPAAIKVGLVAQCPGGPGVVVDFLHFSVEARTVKDLRAGV
jgi:regulation of enolase protein 1 (concanavalin A-like superfamily)